MKPTYEELATLVKDAVELITTSRQHSYVGARMWEARAVEWMHRAIISQEPLSQQEKEHGEKLARDLFYESLEALGDHVDDSVVLDPEDVAALSEAMDGGE